MIYDKREFEDDICIYDPLVELTKAFQDLSIQDFKKLSSENKNLTLEESLKNHIIDGEKIGLEDQLNKALKKYKPLEIINTFLPKQMNEAETIKICKETIQSIKAQGPKDIGKVMGAIKKKYANILDFSKVGSLVKEILK